VNRGSDRIEVRGTTVVKNTESKEFNGRNMQK
jgi:hypothetical protein